ncbi:MAG: glycosyltransferase family 4 protein [Acidimicrobiales bacterium]|nr:glycosyltransferase family 4 protein [Acidimicrobiales bacterium]
MSDPSVCFLVHEGRRSGPPLYALGVVGWLAEHTDLELSVVLVEGGPLTAEFAAHGPTRVWADGPDAALALVDAADIVYVNTAISVQPLRERGRRPPVVVTHVHELEVGLRYWLPAADHDWMIEITDRYLVGPDCAADNLVRRHGIPRDKIAQVPYFVPSGSGPSGRDAVRRSLGVGPDTVLVGTCGGREWRKAPDLFAHAAWEATRAAPGLDLGFVWVGAPLPSSRHWDEAADLALLDLGDRLLYVGDQADIDPWLGAFDLYALCSREDDFPLACLTAASFGVPVVTFDGGGMADLVRDSGGGRVVPYPEVESLAAELVALAGDPGERTAMGTRVAAHVATHHQLDRCGTRVAAELTALAVP